MSDYDKYLKEVMGETPSELYGNNGLIGKISNPESNEDFIKDIKSNRIESDDLEDLELKLHEEDEEMDELSEEDEEMDELGEMDEEENVEECDKNVELEGLIDIFDDVSPLDILEGDTTIDLEGEDQELSIIDKMIGEMDKMEREVGDVLNDDCEGCGDSDLTEGDIDFLLDQEIGNTDLSDEIEEDDLMMGNDEEEITEDDLVGDEDELTEDDLMGNEDELTEDDLMGNEDELTEDDLMGDEEEITEDDLMSDEDELAEDDLMGDEEEPMSGESEEEVIEGYMRELGL